MGVKPHAAFKVKRISLLNFAVVSICVSWVEHCLLNWRFVMLLHAIKVVVPGGRYSCPLAFVIDLPFSQALSIFQVRWYFILHVDKSHFALKRYQSSLDNGLVLDRIERASAVNKTAELLHEFQTFKKNFKLQGMKLVPQVCMVGFPKSNIFPESSVTRARHVT